MMLTRKEKTVGFANLHMSFMLVMRILGSSWSMPGNFKFHMFPTKGNCCFQNLFNEELIWIAKIEDWITREIWKYFAQI